MTVNDPSLRRRGVSQHGAIGVSGYAYRAPEGCEMRAENDGTTITLSHYAVLWGRYSANLGGYVEQFAPDSLDESLRDDDQIASYNHMYETILGRRSAGTLTLEKDNIGLLYTIRMSASDPDAIRVYEKRKHRSINGSSFTFRSTPDGEEWGWTEQDFPVVTVNKARLYEVAPVVWPAYPATEEYDMALRSLAQSSGRALEDLVEAARANRLGEVLRSGEVDGDEQRRVEHLTTLRARIDMRAREVSHLNG